MRFVKRLIILNGEANGTINIEKNDKYCSVKFVCYLKELKQNKYSLCLIVDDNKYFLNVNALKQEFKIDLDGELNVIHAIVFDNDNLIMYGTNQQKRLDYSQLQMLKPKPKVNLNIDLTNRDLFSKREKLENLEKFNKIEKIDKIENVDSREKFDKIENVDKGEKIENVEKIDKIENVESIEKFEKIENVDKEFEDCKAKEFSEQNEDCKAEELSEQNEYCDEQICEQNYYPKSFFELNDEENEMDKERNEKNKTDYSPYKNDVNYLNSLNLMLKNNLKPNREQVKDKQPIIDNVQTKNKESFKILGVDKQIHINAREATFYERMSEDIEKIFNSNQKDSQLEEILPNSKWVRIDYNENGKYYCLGIIGKEYLCYALPAEFSPTPPQELQGYCWWLPLKPDKPKEKGYWIMYQNLNTGEAVLP